MRQLHLSSFDELHRLVCNGCNVAGFCSHFTCKEMIRRLYDYEAAHGVQIILAGSFMLVPRQGSATGTTNER